MLLTAVLLAACTGGAVNQPGAALTAISISPTLADLAPAANQQFAAAARWSDGSTVTPTIHWSSTGGTVSGDGLYTAGGTAGTYRVIATDSTGSVADTAAVSITSSPATLVTLTLHPGTVSLGGHGTQQFSVTGTWSDASTATPAVAYSATGGTITAGGLYTAGTTPGSYRVIAVQQGGTLADTSAVTVTPPTLVQLSLTPPTASIITGATQQFAVSGVWSDASTTTPTATYTATGGTITAGGLYTAGSTAGSFRVIATQQGGTLADTSAVTVTAPVTLTSITLAPATISLPTSAAQQFAVTGHLSNGGTSNPAVTYTATGGTITTGGLYTAGSTTGSFKVIAKVTSGTLADTSSVTVTGSSGGTTLLTEDFETTNWSTKGWYDQTTIPSTTAEHTPGSTRSMMWHWGVGTINPLAVAAARHPITPTNTLYISYWVKFTSNFQGSGKTYHPHEFTVLTNESAQYAGLAHTPLTLLLETTWSGQNGIPRMESADGVNVNQSNGPVPNDLTHVTEQRAASGCNGNPDGLNVSCFGDGAGGYDNTKLKDAASAQFLSSTGAKYKGDWHHVEAYFALNSISGGIGQLDGVMQYWYDGTLVIDEHGVQFRTGAHPNMQLNQFIISPYIGDGSPVDQTEYIDDLTLRTAHP